MLSPIFVSADGFRVEVILIQRSLRRPPIEALRVTWRGYFLRDCDSVAQVAALVPLESLVPTE